MRVFLTCPTFVPHGGIRVLLEWANRLSRRGHEVTVRTDDRRKCDWFAIDGNVSVEHDDRSFQDSECVIVGSPHGLEYLEREGPANRFAFMQMAEHLFRPNDRAWRVQCGEFYRTPYPLILISRWNRTLVERWGRTGETHYVGNGVNLDDFPIVARPKIGSTVLVEGWMPGNPTKDFDRIAAKVSSRLRNLGYRIVAFGQGSIAKDRYRRIPNEYYERPSLEKLNELYTRATILIKASKCDARSCSPMEAMTKGTVTARAIEQGDDDLTDFNSLRCEYDSTELFDASLRLLRDRLFREGLAENCLSYVKRNSWDDHMPRIEGILCRS